MTVDATFTVEGAAVSGAVEVDWGQTVDLAVTTLTGISSIAWSVDGSSDQSLTDPTITPAGVPSGATASYPMVADDGNGRGASFRIKCTVMDAAGNTDTKYAVVGVSNECDVIPGAANEDYDRHATHGYTVLVNKAIADGIERAYSINTTDATEASIVELDLEDDTITDCGCRIWAWETAAPGDTLLRTWTWAYQRQNTGAPTKIVSDSDGGIYSHADDATWEAKVDFSANTMRLRAVGDAANACRFRAQFWATKCPIPN